MGGLHTTLLECGHRKTLLGLWEGPPWSQMGDLLPPDTLPYYSVDKGVMLLLALSLLVLRLWEGPPWSQMGDKLHPDTHNRHSLCNITMKGVHTTLIEQGQRKTVLLGVSLFIWGQMVTDGWCTLPRHQQGRLIWHRHSICNFTVRGVHTSLLER